MRIAWASKECYWYHWMLSISFSLSVKLRTNVDITCHSPLMEAEYGCKNCACDGERSVL